jgi:uncharacterized protein (DUF3084 family)
MSQWQAAPSDSAAMVAAREVEQLVRGLVDQLAQYRRRALSAEARLRTLDEERTEMETRLSTLAEERDRLLAAVADATRAAALVDWPEGLPSPEQVARMREENGLLRVRLDEVSQRARVLADRVRFVRQQVEADPTPSGEERDA